MKSLISCLGAALLWTVGLCADEVDRPATVPATTPIAVEKLDPKLHRQEVTVQFVVSGLGGVTQLSIPGKAPTFVIEAVSDHPGKDLRLWVEGELADVLDRLQLSFGGSNALKKGTIVVATGSLTYLPGAGDRQGHEWYELKVAKWQNFRILPAGPDR